MKLTPNLLENLEYADIVRGSSEDFDILYKKTDADAIYRSQISFYTKNFILTDSSNPVELRAEGGIKKQYPVEKTDGVTREMIMTGISEELWDKIIACGLQFSANVCKSINNSVDAEFGHKMAKEMKEY